MNHHPWFPQTHPSPVPLDSIHLFPLPLPWDQPSFLLTSQASLPTAFWTSNHEQADLIWSCCLPDSNVPAVSTISQQSPLTSSSSLVPYPALYFSQLPPSHHRPVPNLCPRQGTQLVPIVNLWDLDEMVTFSINHVRWVSYTSTLPFP